MFQQISVPMEISGDGRDLLLCGDATQPLPELQALEGQAQCVYMDPPFMTGEMFTRRRRFGQHGWQTGRPSVEYPAYSDRFASREEYLSTLRGLVQRAHQLLKNTGVMYLHLDWRASAYGRLICDEIFGEEMFLNEIVWSYESGGRARKYFSRKHDVILMYAKTSRYHFDLHAVPLKRTVVRHNHMRRGVDEDGRAYSAITSGGKEYRYYDDDPVYPGDVWTDISHLQQRDPERTGYATQKPLKLLDRLLRPVVKPGSLVCDLCCGAGTTLLAAQKLGCRVAGVEISPEALLIARSRLTTDNMTLICPCTDDPAALEGTYDATSGLTMLTGFDAPHEAFPPLSRALDALESWSAGVMENGILHTESAFGRTTKQPSLPQFCILSQPAPNACVSTVDAAGRRRVYQWQE